MSAHAKRTALQLRTLGAWLQAVEQRRCRHCSRAREPVFEPVPGGWRDVTPPCGCPGDLEERKICGRCRTARARKRKGERVCDTCRVKCRPWIAGVDVKRRRRGVCQRCDRPVAGRKKQALYCERHRKESQAEAQRRHRRKVGNRHGRAFYRRNRKRILAACRRRNRLPQVNRHRCDQKRAWRRKNRDKVAAQKRRHALRGKSAAAARRRRERLGAAARTAQNPAPRNEHGERLCLGDGCDVVLRGRAKMCERCKAGGAPGRQERAA